jgi:hypothetical protein
MSEAPDSHSEFEPGGDRPAPDSERFWGAFGRAGSARAPRRSSGNGSASPPPHEEPAPPAAHEHQCLEWCPICRTAEVLRGTTTPGEVRDQVAHVQHDALIALRSALNAYIERLEKTEGRGATRPVEDIPID